MVWVGRDLSDQSSSKPPTGMSHSRTGCSESIKVKFFINIYIVFYKHLIEIETGAIL